ncbi:MAG: L,D-transpeptidase [Candidatus Thiodiazotropha taylori]|uniref:L,D-transpeptidase n=1 Tax=Candidatus Thiodiazotropha taylori TaxID=2792791 RepID=A0A9E4PZZ2_9GAMM|nr:L,D-transpeptidase [Candidatus Thiodiazotropha taylori]MCG7967169.1 L,D-transpeptidase [Candidatus Thiodiazotropha taylori]MCG8030161.1 L,D-transpeptidase [Candidatus Thiodiazotropha taylori]MCG8043199.1 L,D-transpeptidase [Candidatus Thiodiazotropha taylori]MCG8055118.1 L,D-transpeptidase [Candidatus Thiodiazotropha taylori]
MCNRQLQIDLANQQLSCLESGQTVASYPVSTGLNGPGESQESGCTPRGKHRVRIKIGADCPLDTVFVGRRPTGERYSEMLAEQQPERDWVLTRIIWLSGLESGFNRGGRVDTLRRYIYIHGTPDSEPMGVPRSHGCIRMHSRDLIELFDWVEPGMLVEIRD